jgi:hypothetical protein
MILQFFADSPMETGLFFMGHIETGKASPLAR